MDVEHFDIEDMEVDLRAHNESSYKQRINAKKCLARSKSQPKWKQQLRALKAHATIRSRA